MKSYSKPNKATKILLLGFLIIFSSCTQNFEEYNTDIHGIDNELINVDGAKNYALIPQMQFGVYFPTTVWQFQLQQNLIGDIYSQFMMPPTPFRANDNNMTYSLVDGWNQYPFIIAYAQVMPQWLSLKKETETAIPYYYAIANIIKVAAMHRVADTYGPLPYTKYGESSTSTPYDGLDVVYQTMFSELDDAIAKLKAQIAIAPVIAALNFSDKMYKGDLNKWLKFANSLKLRLGMRIVKIDPAMAKQKAEEAITGGVFGSNSDNALVSEPGLSHPLTTINNAWNDIRMGASMESMLVGYNDPRLPVYFQKSVKTGDYKGIRIAIDIQNKGDYQDYSKLGAYFDGDVPIQIMTAAEVAFLKAEGALRGWNMGNGTPESLYQEGITTSCNQWGVSVGDYLNTTAMPANYTDPFNSSNDITAVNSVSVKWDNADTDEVKLQKIITQKWIALYPDGQEAWSEYRRTGYPKLFPAIVNNSSGKIDSQLGVRRINFPESDKNTNEAEVNKAVQLLKGEDNGGTRLWWDVDKANF